MPGISFRVPKKEPLSPKKPKPVASARVKVEPGIVKPEPSEAWHAKYAVAPVYRSKEDGEWASWQGAVRLSAKEADDPQV
jgi:hypothetical protein